MERGRVDGAFVATPGGAHTATAADAGGDNSTAAGVDDARAHGVERERRHYFVCQTSVGRLPGLPAVGAFEGPASVGGRVDRLRRLGVERKRSDVESA